jgi:hypothetical protein
LPFWLQDFISFRKSAAFQICRLAWVSLDINGKFEASNL